jgi:hypothetical protein
MAPVLKVLLEFLRTVRLARDYIKRFPRRATSLLAFLGRKLNLWWRFWLGSFGRPKPTERPCLGTEASTYSVSGSPAVVREYVVAASSVPASASYQILHERTQSQPAAVAQTAGAHPLVITSPSIDHPSTPNPPHPLGGTSLVSRSYGSLSAVSIQSRASDRFSIISKSRESKRAPLGQPSRVHHDFLERLIANSGVAGTHRGQGTDGRGHRPAPRRTPFVPKSLQRTYLLLMETAK